jgi:hypothetical protein
VKPGETEPEPVLIVILTKGLVDQVPIEAWRNPVGREEIWWNLQIGSDDLDVVSG